MTLHVHVFNLTMSAFAFHATAFTFSVLIHGFKELLFAIHTLELDIGVASFRWERIGVSVFDDKSFGLDLNCLQSGFNLQNSLSGLFFFSIKNAETLVESLFVVEESTHMLHVLKVACTGQSHVHVPDIVLVLVRFSSVSVDITLILFL